MIPLGELVNVVMYLIFLGMIVGLLFWLIGYCGLPEPFAKVARVILAVFSVFAVIGLLLSLVGGQPMFRP